MDPLCADCGPDANCPGHHIYVIELDLAVLENTQFMEQNPDYMPGKSCFYVGATGHTVRCRFNQHQLFGDPEALGFECSCFGDTTTRYFRGRHEEGKTKGNKFVGTYGKYLRGRQFKHENPFETKDDAEEREKALAEELRLKGHGVWQN